MLRALPLVGKQTLQPTATCAQLTIKLELRIQSLLGPNELLSLQLLHPLPVPLLQGLRIRKHPSLHIFWKL